MQRENIRDTEPSTSCLRSNPYHINVRIFVLDVLRIFQDHPRYCNGLKEKDIMELWEKQSYACGDIESQVRNALKELMEDGFVRFINNGYRTLGQFAKLANARTVHEYNMAWERISQLQTGNSATSLSSSRSMQSYNR